MRNECEKEEHVWAKWDNMIANGWGEALPKYKYFWRCVYCGKETFEKQKFDTAKFEENLFKTKSTFGCLNRASARVKGYPWESPEITQKYIREVR